MTLESGGDRAVFAGDLLHTPLQLHAPHLSSCFCHDRPAAARTRRTVLEWAADHTALVIPAHFAGAGAVEIERNGSGFNARLWNDANVLALSLKRLAPDVAVECARAFLEVEAEDPSDTTPAR